MNTAATTGSRKSQVQFILRFQRRLMEALARYQSTAEGFGPAWEKTLEEVPLAEPEQPQVYWDLIAWARREELFTHRNRLKPETRSV